MVARPFWMAVNNSETNNPLYVASDAAQSLRILIKARGEVSHEFIKPHSNNEYIFIGNIICMVGDIIHNLRHA